MAQRAPRPYRELRRVPKKAVGHLPIGHGDRRAPLAARGEGSFALGGEVARRDRVGCEVERVVHENREHHAVGIDTGAAEHVADAHRAEAREQIFKKFLVADGNGHDSRPFGSDALKRSATPHGQWQQRIALPLLGGDGHFTPMLLPF